MRVVKRVVVCNERKAIYRTDRDRTHFLDLLARWQERSRPGFAEVIGVVERIKGEPWLAFRDRRGDWGRDLALHLGREFAGLTLAELRKEVKAGTPMAVSSAVRRFRERLALEKPLRKLQARAIEQLGDR